MASTFVRDNTIYNYEGRPIGEIVDNHTNWYYSDGPAGGENGGHFLSTYEFLQFNGLLNNDEYDDY